MNNDNYKMNKKGGFTLVELVITIAIVAILSSIAIPTTTILIKRSQSESSKQIVNTILIDTHSYLTNIDKLGNNVSDLNSINLIENTVYSLKTELIKKYPKIKFVVVSDKGNFKPHNLPINLASDMFKLGPEYNNNTEYTESFILVYLNTSANKIQVAKYTNYKLEDIPNAVQVKKYVYKYK